MFSSTIDVTAARLVLRDEDDQDDEQPTTNQKARERHVLGDDVIGKVIDSRQECRKLDDVLLAKGQRAAMIERELSGEGDVMIALAVRRHRIRRRKRLEKSVKTSPYCYYA